MITALIVVAILVLLIVAHEFGHFVAAKLFKVKVLEFGIGYPPRALTFGRWGGTEYTLNWVPFGGFVRLFGDEGQAPQKGRGSFADAPRGVQILILIAGVAMNALMAWVLFTLALHIGIPQVVGSPVTGAHTDLMVAAVVPGSPADAAGFVLGDKITAVSDVNGAQIQSLTPSDVVNFVKDRGGKPITIAYIHSGKAESTTVTPAHAVIPNEADRPALGVKLALVSIHSLPWLQAAQVGLVSTGDAFQSVAGGLWSIVTDLFRGQPALQDVVGPVGLVNVVNEAAQNGLGNVLALAAFISVNLTLINLLPIPALDGGRLLLVIVEIISRRAAPRLAVQLLNTLGIALIVLLMITVTNHDVARLFA